MHVPGPCGPYMQAYELLGCLFGQVSRTTDLCPVIMHNRDHRFAICNRFASCLLHETHLTWLSNWQFQARVTAWLLILLSNQASSIALVRACLKLRQWFLNLEPSLALAWLTDLEFLSNQALAASLAALQCNPLPCNQGKFEPLCQWLFNLYFRSLYSKTKHDTI